MLITKEHFDKIYKENKIPYTCLVLMLNEDCNAKCKVCIGNQTFKSELCKKVCEGFKVECRHCCGRTATDEEYFKRVNAILKTVNSPFVQIIFTGGEPTISPRLMPAMELIDKYNYQAKMLEIESNGANLLDEKISNELIKRDVKILLSRYCIDDKLNTSEFGYVNKVTTNKEIKKLAKLYKGNLTLNTILLKKFIPNSKALLEFVDFYRQYGIKTFDFTEFLADTSLRNANKELLEYYDEQFVSIKDISVGMPEKINEFTDGIFTIINYKYKDCEILISSSVMSKQKDAKTKSDSGRFLIMPSGEIGVNGIETR